MLWKATLKPIGCCPAVGEIHFIRVSASDRDEAVSQVRVHAQIEGAGAYAITQIEEVKKDGRP